MMKSGFLALLVTAAFGLTESQAAPLYQLNSGGTYNPATDKLVTVRNGGGVNNPEVLTSLAASAATDTTNATNITSGTLPAARLPAPTGTTLGGVQASSGATNNFLTGISTLGVPTYAQPSFSSLSGSIGVSQMNSGTGASSSTFWRGDGTWATPAAGSSPGGTSGQLQYNNAGSLGGFTLSGDCTLVVGTGVITCGKTGGVNFAASATTDTTNAANITSGVLASARGGAGTVSGIVKANGSGLTSAAVAGTDFQAPITLTTTGTSGAATLSGNTLNIPQYSGGGGSVSLTAGTRNVALSPSTITGTGTIGGQWVPVDLGTATSYTITSGNMNGPVTIEPSSLATVSIPAASTTGFTAGNSITIINLGSANATISPASGTINFQASISLAPGQSADIGSTGTNYIASLGAPTANGNIAFLNVAQTFQYGQSGTISTPAISTSTFTPDLNAANHFTFGLVHAACPCTIAAPANVAARVGSTGVLEIDQSSAGSDTVTWNSVYKFSGGTAPTLSTSASAQDFFSYYVKDSTHVIVSSGIKNAF